MATPTDSELVTVAKRISKIQQRQQENKAAREELDNTINDLISDLNDLHTSASVLASELEEAQVTMARLAS